MYNKIFYHTTEEATIMIDEPILLATADVRGQRPPKTLKPRLATWHGQKKEVIYKLIDVRQ